MNSFADLDIPCSRQLRETLAVNLQSLGHEHCHQLQQKHPVLIPQAPTKMLPLRWQYNQKVTGSPTAAMSVDFVSCRHVCVEVFDSTANGLCEPNAAPDALVEPPSPSPKDASKEALRNALSMCAYANARSNYSSSYAIFALLSLQSAFFKASSSKPPLKAFSFKASCSKRLPQSLLFQSFFFKALSLKASCSKPLASPQSALLKASSPKYILKALSSKPSPQSALSKALSLKASHSKPPPSPQSFFFQDQASKGVAGWS